MPSTKDYCTDLEAIDHDFLKAITAEEVQDPSKYLPFVITEEAQLHVKMAAEIFKKGIAGGLRERFVEWAERHDLPVTVYAHIQFIIMLMVFQDVTPALNDFKAANFKVGLDLMKADPDWMAVRSDALHKQHGCGEPRAYNLMAYERFRAVGTFGWEHHVWDRPFWELPTADEVRQVRAVSSHRCTTHGIPYQQLR